jgi:D-alanyl-D-alanine carboxypeptidase
MSVRAQPLPHLHRLHRRTWWLLAILLAGGLAIGIRTTLATQRQRAPRPDLQRVLDELVRGRSALAPGAAAYVSGPRGSWLGAADTRDLVPMSAAARMRLESVSKIFTATLIEELAQEERLRLGDTVARWLPGLLPYGNRITLRQLLTMQSGIIDNNDLRNASAAEQRTYLGNVKDARLRARLLALGARVEKNQATEFSPLWWVRYAAWQPLLFTPGRGFHYSNIGYEILGLVASRAGGKSLSTLFQERIFDPLDLDSTAYDPQGSIAGPHARGYGIEPNGARFDTTDWHAGIGAEGGIVSDAEDTATFLTALMKGTLVDRERVIAMEGDDLWLGGAESGCGVRAYGWSGGGMGYKTEVWVSDRGDRVAVLLLNARHLDTAQPLADETAHTALVRLFCLA